MAKKAAKISTAKPMTSLEKARAAKAAKIQAQKEQLAIDALVGDDEQEAAPIRRHRREDLREERATPRAAARGRKMVVGRDGEQLSRKRTSSGDIFEIPLELIPKGWEYQWVAISVTGNTEILLDQNLMMRENGWRPVPSERYPGRFMEAGHKGPIIRGGQMLMERPKELSDEARAEDIAAARQLISDRNESLKLSKAKAELGPGFEMGKRYRGTGGDIRMSIDRSLDMPEPPQHQLAGGDDE